MRVASCVCLFLARDDCFASMGRKPKATARLSRVERAAIGAHQSAVPEWEAPEWGAVHNQAQGSRVAQWGCCACQGAGVG